MGPSNRTRPFSRNTARWARVRATLHGLLDDDDGHAGGVHLSDLVAEVATTVGARPSDSSSMNSTFGWP